MIALEFFEEHGLAGAADTVDQQAGHADSSSHGVQGSGASGDFGPAKPR
jgi:hypothetical protein